MTKIAECLLIIAVLMSTSVFAIQSLSDKQINTVDEKQINLVLDSAKGALAKVDQQALDEVTFQKCIPAAGAGLVSLICTCCVTRWATDGMQQFRESLRSSENFLRYSAAGLITLGCAFLAGYTGYKAGGYSFTTLRKYFLGSKQAQPTFATAAK